MDPWPYRESWKRALKDYRERKKVSIQALAETIGLTYNSLHGYLYTQKGKPSLEVLQRCSALTGVSISEWIDDPFKPIAGQGMSTLSEQDRALAHMMFHDFTAEDLTTEDRKHLYDALTLHRAQLRALKARKS